MPTAVPTSRVTIAHKAPGRVRLKFPDAKGDIERLERARQMFASVAGIDSVKVKPDAGSIILLFDPARDAEIEASIRDYYAKHIAELAKHEMARAAEKPANEFDELTKTIEEEAKFLAEHSQTARALVEFCGAIDRELKRATNNVLDLKLVLALGLCVVTFVGIGAEAATPMWVTLALFGLNHIIEVRAGHPTLATAAA